MVFMKFKVNLLYLYSQMDEGVGVCVCVGGGGVLGVGVGELYSVIISPVSEGSGDVMVLRRSRPPPAMVLTR